MASILQQAPPAARDSGPPQVCSWLLILAFFLWPYYDAPTLLLTGKLALAASLPLLVRTAGPVRWSPCLGAVLLGALGFLALAYLSVAWSPAPWRTFKHVSEEVFLNLVVAGAAFLWALAARDADLKRLVRLALASYLLIVALYAAFFLL